MSNVKPMDDQTWKKKRTKVTFEVNTVGGSDVYFIGVFDPVTLDELYSDFEFIPQNDLECLACDNVKIPNGENFAYFSNHIDRRVKFCKHMFKDGKTQREIQNKRYELGLDEETKMIDLSTAKVGDKFVLNNGIIVTMKCFSKRGAAGECPDGYLYLFNVNGSSDEFGAHGDSDSGYDIVSKHDPRHWLKDLPDVANWNDGWLACDKNEKWYYYTNNPNTRTQSFSSAEGASSTKMFKMPTLTGDEWKQSKISIPDLKTWQGENK